MILMAIFVEICHFQKSHYFFNPENETFVQLGKARINTTVKARNVNLIVYLKLGLSLTNLNCVVLELLLLINSVQNAP